MNRREWQAVRSHPVPWTRSSTLAGLLRERARDQPDRRAYTLLDPAADEPAALTYGELDARARAIAARLQQLDGAGRRALLLYPPGLEFVAAFLGCLAGGVVAVPVQPMTSERGLPRLLAIARDARSSFALTTSRLLGRLQAAAGRLPELDAVPWVATDQISPALGEEWQDPQPEAETLAFLQYTSGSTASPKGVMVSHGNLMHNEEMIQRAFGQSADSVIVGWLPLYHDMGLIGNVLQPLFLGAHAILMSPGAFLKRPLSWLEAITRYRATTSGGPNFAYELCLRKIGGEQRAGLDLSSWEVAFNGAEPVRAETLERFAESFAPQGFRRSAFYPCYGLAEATLFVAGGGKGLGPVIHCVDRPSLARGEVLPGETPLVGCGRPWREQAVAIVDPESGRRLPEDQVGEIWVSGPSVAQGYWDRPEATARDFHAYLEGGEGPFLRTGDLGFLRGGELFVAGRLKDLIILRGRNLYPQDLELTAEHTRPELRPGCSAAFAVDVESEERLVLACELEHRTAVDGGAVAEEIRRALAQEHEVQPHEILLLEPGTIPKTSSGKIQRHACRARYLAGELAVRWRSLGAAPAEDDHVERDSAGALGEEVARILGLPSSSLDLRKPLTAYGLDSLAAVEIQHALESRLGASVDLSDLLRGITLQQLAAKILARPAGEPPHDLPVPTPMPAAGAPLSYGQRALWFLQRLQPSNAAYNISAAVDVRSRLDPEALRRSLEHLAWRHEALRYTFVETADGPVQRVCPGRTLEIHQDDATGWSAALLDARLLELACRPFDLERDPLLRVALFRTAPGEHTLLLVVHHIVADLWSLAVLARDLGDLYSRGGEEPSAPPALRFTDYVAWQERLLAGERGEALWAYWSEQLGGELPALDLPADRPRPPTQTFRGGGRSLALSAALLERVRALGARHDATLYATLLAAFQALLHRHARQDDVLVGSPISARTSAVLGDVVGYFANPVVLRSDLSGRPTFEELLSRVRETALAAFEHQDYPFPLLVERLQPERDPSRSPLFQALFVLERAPLRGGIDLAALALGESGVRIELGGLTLESRRLGRATSQLDLELLAAETGHGLGMVLVYNSDLFDGSTAERLLASLQALLAGAAEHPDRRVAELPLLAASERQQLLREWNDTAPASADGRGLHELVADQAAATPDAAAVVCGSSQMTYAELERRANRLARHLQALGVGAEARVGVCLERGPELAPALLAILKAGGAYVPLDPNYPQERLDLLLEDAQVPVLVTQASLAPRFEGIAARVLVDAGRGAIAARSPEPPRTRVGPDQLAYLIYTSGSTGRPKGVAITHRNAVALVRWSEGAFGEAELAGVLASTSISFDLSVFELFVPLGRGGTAILAADALALAELPQASRVTLINTVPSAIAELVRLGPPPPDLRTVNLAGEPLKRSLVQQIERWRPGVRVLNLYGPSEDTTYSTWARVSGAEGTVPIGRPVDGTAAYLLDREGGPVPRGTPGELHLTGAGLARGYLGRPELTAAKFVPDPFSEVPGGRMYATGDLARLRPDGSLEFLGRIDHQVKIRGFRIEPGEIEALLASRPGVEAAAVVPQEAGPDDLRLVAYVARPAPDLDELRGFLAQRLPRHMVPAAFVALSALPLTPNGKLDRRALPRPDWAGSEAAATAPRNPTEERLVALFAEMLGVEAGRIGIDTNFFALGGHSLLATRLVSRVRQELRVDVPLRALFHAPTPAGLARLVLAGRQGPEAPPIRPVPRTGDLPLSFAQEGLWFLDQLDPGSPMYNIPIAVRLSGRLDVPALAAGLREIVRRHEPLRTTFGMERGTPVQRIAPPGSVDLPVADLSALHRPDEAAHRLGAEESRRGFDLERGPLWRAALLRLGPDEHLLLFNLHHTVADGWSLGVLTREISALYTASPLPELPIQYADFAAWQRQWLTGEVLERQLAYWRERLAGAPALELPCDRPPGETRGTRGASLSVEIPGRELEELARREGVTPFMVLLAGFAALLSRHAGQEDVSIGTAIANRTRAETEGLIGFFANTLVLRTGLSGDPAGRDLLARVREVTLDAHAYQDLPFERLVQELQPRRDAGTPPLLRAVMTLGDEPALSLPGVSTETWPRDTGTAKFDLTLQLAPGDRGLAGFLEYSTELFDAPTPRRLMRQLAALLGDLAADPGRRVSGLSLLAPAERHQLQTEWSGVSAPALESTLPGLFAEQVQLRPEAVAVSLGGQRLTYAELDRRANRLAGHLRRLGVGPEVPVGVALERSLDLIVALVAIVKSGGAYLPLDPGQPPERRAFLLAQAGATIVLAPEILSGSLPDAAPPAPGLHPDNLAYILYTSGSTGEPKGVAVTHRAVVRLVRDTNYAGFGPEEVFLQLAPVAFDASTLEIWGPLLNGGRLALAPPGPLSPAELEQVIAEEGVTTLWLTAGLFHQMVDQASLRGLRQLLAGGDVLSPPHVRRALEQLPGCVLVNGYGPTENTTFTCCHPMAGPEEVPTPVPIGRPIARTSVHVVDPEGRPSPVGVPGELWAGGDGLARGYVGRPDLTAERFVADPFGPPGSRLYRTGDRVRFLPGGHLEFLGRLDQQVKIRGFRIEPGEIEAVLASHPAVAGVAVVPQDVGPDDRRLVAYVAGQDLDLAELRDLAARRLPGYMVPSVFIDLPALPLTPNGKVDRRALPRPDRTRDETVTAPRNPTEERLVLLWGELLGVETGGVGIDSSFFDLGGHSLLATRLVGRIRDDLRVEVPLQSVFEDPTPAGVARLVLAARDGSEEPIRPVPRTGSLPLSFAQERLWFIDQLEPGSPLYNIPAAARLSGRLDVPALAAGLRQVVRRHEPLRTTFAVEQGAPVQRISPPGDGQLPVIDLSALPLPAEAAQRLGAEESRRGFDLERGPLWRAALLRLGTDEHLLLFTLHHTIADGWSLGVFARELSALYAASPLPELPIQYADFAVWQRQWLTGEVLERQLGYWRERLAGAPALELPGDRPPRETRGTRGASLPVEIPGRELEELARREGVTPFMVLLAGFAALLSRHAGHEDVSIGTAIANRTRAETEGMIGFFANTLVLRTDLAEDPAGRDLLARVREVTLDAYAHQDLPFERLVQELQPRRDAGTPPLLRAVLTLGDEPALALPGVSAETWPRDTGTAKFDLTLQLSWGKRGLAGVLEYSTELFDAPTPRRLMRQLAALLGDLAADPGRKVSGLSLLAPAERHQIQVEWSGAFGQDLEATLPGLFAEQVRLRPEAVAVSLGGQRLTYAELDRQANRLAGHLRGLGVGPEVPVGVALERSLDLIVALVAIVKSGGAYLPLDPGHPPERRAFLLEQAGATIVLTPEDLSGSLPDAAPPAPGLHPDNLAYILYTSGSTGDPKGVAVTHRAVVRLVRDTNYASFGPEEVFLQLAPVAFDASTLEIWGPLLNGGRLALAPPGPLSPAELEQVIADEGVTTLWLTAGLFHQMVDQASLRGLRQLLAGGDVLSPPHVRRALEQLPGCVLVNGYGPTENTTFTCCHRMASPEEVATPVPIGRPVARTSVHVVDPEGRPSPVGVPGELWTGGDGLARGYAGRPDLTAERFVADPFGEPGSRLYRTGDRVRFLPGGHLEFLGRLDQQVKIRGFRIEPGEIEAVLASHPAVAGVAVVPQDVGPDDRRLVAYVAGQGLDLGELRDLAARRLPAYMVPAVFLELPALPLTPNGKVDRRALPRPDWSRGETRQAAPRNPTEELLVALWAELLDLEPGRVGTDSSFFDLGGHSLLATRLVGRIREDLQVEVPLHGVFEDPTPAGVARLVLAAREGSGEPIRPAPRTGSLPLSFAQERLWFLDQLEPGTATYNIPLAVRLKGRLDVPALAASLREIARRHEALRTTFALEQGRPVQRIADPGPATLPVLPVIALADPAEAQRLISEESARGFDLERGPLWHATLLRLGHDEHLLLLTLHHIVSDGWSMGVLVRELSALYAGSPLPDLPVQYPDVAVWQRRRLESGALAEQGEHWRRQLAGLGVLQLPTDRPRTPARTSRGASVSFHLPADLRAGLEEAARRERATLFMVLLGGFQALLSRYADQEDVALGTAIANRNRAETEDLIGLFVNTLVLRTDLAGDPDRRELLRRVRRVTLDAYAHQDLPFEKVVEELSPERDLSRSPLVDVLLILQNMPLPDLVLPGVEAEPLPVPGRTARLDLTLSLFPRGDGLAGWLEFATDLFDEVTVQRMAGHYELLLEGLADPAREPRLSALPLLTAAERAQLLAAWSDVELAECLHEAFAAQASAAPGAVAVVCGESRLTYGEVEERASLVARRLLALGIGAETPVGVCLERGPDLVPALLGILEAGGAYLPLDPAYPQERLDLLVEDARVPVLVTQSSLASRFPGVAAHVLVDGPGEAVDPVPRPAVDPDQLAYFIYTSGSTGRPKGVAIPHRSAVALVRWTLGRFSQEELAGVLASTSICFDLSVFELFVPLSRGGAVVLAPDALALPELPAASEVTLINTVPSAVAELVRLGPPPPALRTVNLAGEPLQRALVQQVERWRPGVRVLNLYGPSEDTTYSTWAEVSGEVGTVTIGRPVAGTSAYLLDRHGNPVPRGVPGELHLAGAGLARGYFGRPDLTAAKFVPDPFAERPGGRLYATGDLARLRRDGNLEFLGRRDHQVKIRGFRIELGEIEAALCEHPAVREAAVLAREGSLAAYVTLEGQAETAELRAFLQRKLPAHMVPGAFAVLDAFPLTPNGKIDRRALPAPSAAPAAAAPRALGPFEEAVTRVLAEALGRERVGADDSFFELGGHSLLATRVVSRLREMGFELPVRQLFETPTAAALAAALAQRHGEGVEPPIVRLPRTGTLPLSYSQERLWFLDRLQPGNASYNMPIAARLRGALDPGLLARSLNEVVRRHEVLRTTFGAVDGQPFQRVADRLEIPLPVVDLSILAGRDAELGRQIAAEKATPFDLETGPLLRARLFRLAAEDWVLLVDLHHIVSDGWSLRRLFSELAWLYGAFLAGVPSPLPGLEVQYGDYACWQRGWFRGEVLERQLDHWRRELDGTLPVLDLPTDRPRPPVQTFQGGSASALLPPEVCAGLQALGRRERVTLFMTMFAAFNLLLHRFSGQEDLLVGIPIAGRNRAQTEDLIGFFINSLVLRTDLSGRPTFAGLLARVRRTSLDAYAHQDLPFERLLQELRRERDLSRTPLFQVYFNFQGFMGPLPAMPGLEVEGLSGEEELSKFDLTLYVLEEGDGRVRLDLVYNATLFGAERCREMLDQYVAVLAQVSERPDAGIDEVSLLTPRALSLLPDDTLELDAGWMGPVHRNLTAWAALEPERVAVADPSGAWTYGELEAQSNRLAHRLLAHGIRKEETVAIYAHRSAALVWAVLGTLQAGAAFVIVDPAYPPARIIEILRLARPRFWLALESAGAVPEPLAGFVAALPGCGSLTLPPWSEGAGALAGLPEEDPGIPVGPDDLAYISFTSGSTGIPKGILGRHGPLSHFQPWQCGELGLRGSDRFSLLSGLAHDPLQRDLFTPLYLGARICIPDPAEIAVPGRLSAWMRREGVSVAHLTPAMGQVLTETGPQAADRLPDLRYVLLVGDVLTRRDVARLQRLAPGVTVVNLYGSTETQRAVAWHVVAPAEGEAHEKEVLPLGRGMKDVQLLVRNRAGRRAGIGELGEIGVRSPHLARGYLGDEAATARKFLANPATGRPGDRIYLTGDLGRYLPDGEVAFAGRADTQVKIRGFRIELGEIESQLGRVEGVREAVVLATEDGGAGGRLVAFVVAEPGSEAALSAAGLRGHLKAVMPAYMVPSAFLFLLRIPLTPNGKVERRELLRLAGAHRDGGNGAFHEPRTQAEVVIAGILREVLGVERVGAEDNFFDLGGNSLLLLQVQSRVQAAFHRELPVFEIFSNPTVSALARHLTAPEPAASAPAEDDAAGQLEAGKRRRQRRFQQNQKAAERRPGGFHE